MHRAPLGLAVAVLVVALAPAAASAAGPIPVREYVKRADRVCRATDKAGDKIDLPSSDAAVPAWFDQYVAIATTRVQQLTAIPLPGSHRETAKGLRKLWPQELAVVTAMQADLHAGATYPATLKKHEKRIDSLSRSENRRWKELGSKDCYDEDAEGDDDG